MTTLHSITSPEQVTKVLYLDSGSVVYEQEVGEPFKVTNNIFKLTTLLQADTVTPTFNQVALQGRSGETLAELDLGQPYIKLFGTRVRLEAYFDIVASNIWLEVTETDTVYKMSSVASVDSLPQARDVQPNAFVVGCGDLNPVIAYADQRGLWNFTEYDSILSYRSEYDVVSASGNKVTIDISTVDESLASTQPESIILQFLDSHAYSVCRKVVRSEETDTRLVYTLATPVDFSLLPTKVAIYKRKMLGDDYIVPIATRERLGVVKIGDGLLITESGVLSVDPAVLPDTPVLSVNGMTGHVTIDTSKFVKSVDGLFPDANGNINLPEYSLPIASGTRLGGVRVGETLVVDSDGILDVNQDLLVLSLNGMTGHITIPNLVQKVNGIGPDATGNIQLPPYELPVATHSTLGGIIVGDHLSVTSEGKVSVSLTGLVTSVNGKTGDVILDPYELPAATEDELGGVIIGTGFVVEDGRISLDMDLFPEPPVLSVNGKTGVVELDPYTLPIASTDTLGGIKVGNTLTINSSGVLEVDVSKLPLHPDPYVTSVNGLTGDVVIPEYVLPIASRSVLGGVKIGEGFTIDNEGLLTVDQFHYEIVTATPFRLGMVRVGTYLNITADGILDVNWSSLPYATRTTRGPIQPSHESFLIEDGVLSVNWDAAPLASSSTRGAVLPSDHFTITNGILGINYDNFPVATTSSRGAVIVGEGIDVSSSGVISLPERDDPVITLNGRNSYVTIEGLIDPQEISGVIPNTLGIYTIGPSTTNLPIPYEAGQQAIAFGYGSLVKLVYLAPSSIAGKTYIRQGSVWRNVSIIENYATRDNPGLIKVGETLIINSANKLDIRNLLNDTAAFQINGTTNSVGIKPWHHNNTVVVTSMAQVNSNAASLRLVGNFYDTFTTNSLVGFTTELHFAYNRTVEMDVEVEFTDYTTTIEGETVRVEYVVPPGYRAAVNGVIPNLPEKSLTIPKIVTFTVIEKVPAQGSNPVIYRVYLHGELIEE